MFPHNDYVLTETQRLQRAEMMQAAANDRLANAFLPRRVSLVDRGLCCAWRLMVCLGRQLERRGNPSPAAA